MLNLEKIFTVKSNATRDIRKAIECGECKAGEYEAQAVDGGFQIKAISTERNQTSVNNTPESSTTTQPETPAAENASETPQTSEPPTTVVVSETPKATDKTEIPERQLAVLNALMGAKSLEGKTASERAGAWIPFTDIHDSNNPHNLPIPAIPGITGALKRKNLVQTDWGKDANGKRAVIITITEAGIAVLQKVS